MKLKIQEFFLRNRIFLIFLLLWMLLFSGIRTVQHFSFGTNALDLSLIDYGMYYTLKGGMMADPFHKYAFGKWYNQNGELMFEPGIIKSWDSHFSIHFTPIIFFIVPFYLFFEGPLFLLYLQVLLVGLSAVPLYFIAKSVFKEKYIPLIITVVYLFFRHLLMGLMYDFHTEMFFPLFLLGGYYFIVIKKRPLLYLFFVTLALFIKENIAFYLFFFGIFLFFKIKIRKYGLVTSILSLLYLLLALGIIIPYFRSQEGLKGSYEFLYTRGHLGENFTQVLWNFFIHPGVLFEGVSPGILLRKLSNLILPLLILPLFSSYVLLILPPLLIAIISRNPKMYTFGHYYSATLLPFIFLSLIYGLKNLSNFFEKKRKNKIKKIFLIILILLLLINITNSNFWRIIRPSRYRALHDYKQVKQIINQLPPDASVATLSSIIPHIPKRKNIYMLPEVNNAKYIIIDSGINLWPFKKEEFENFINKLSNQIEWTCIKECGKIKLFKKTNH